MAEGAGNIHLSIFNTLTASSKKKKKKIIKSGDENNKQTSAMFFNFLLNGHYSFRTVNNFNIGMDTFCPFFNYQILDFFNNFQEGTQIPFHGCLQRPDFMFNSRFFD